VDVAVHVRRSRLRAAGQRSAAAAAALTARGAARRHDDGTASAVAGHVAWVLLGMMGSWTEQLHALPARAPPSAVFAALREQTTEAEAEEVPLEGAQRL